MMTKNSIKVIAVLFLLSVQLFAQNEAEKVKSLFVYNFTRYIEWPQTDGTFYIGVLGSDQNLLAAFREMASKKSTPSMKIIVKQFSNPAEAEGYNLVYIPESNSRSLKQISGRTKTLVVTEKAGMTKYGSDINFVQHGGKIRFEMNKGSIDKTELKVSSQLMSLAIMV
ncbi:MAG: YfiR family protein [Bacteroidota bacterium]